MTNYFLAFFTIIIFASGVIKKVNCYESFIEGALDGAKNVINMFSFVLAFVLAINLLNSSHLLEYLSNKVNFKYCDLLIQAIVRPFSSSSSLSIMLKNYEKYGVDSKISLMSTFIHTVSDSTFYMISFYFGLIGVKNVGKALLCGMITNILGIILSVAVIMLFLN